MGTLSGLTNKLYWRKAGGNWHCYKKFEEGGFISLCGKVHILQSGGQSCSRPMPIARCAKCDILEMERRGWNESGPTSNEHISAR